MDRMEPYPGGGRIWVGRSHLRCRTPAWHAGDGGQGADVLLARRGHCRLDLRQSLLQRLALDSQQAAECFAGGSDRHRCCCVEPVAAVAACPGALQLRTAARGRPRLDGRFGRRLIGSSRARQAAVVAQTSVEVSTCICTLSTPRGTSLPATRFVTSWWGCPMASRFRSPSLPASPEPLRSATWWSPRAWPRSQPARSRWVLAATSPAAASLSTTPASGAEKNPRSNRCRTSSREKSSRSSRATA